MNTNNIKVSTKNIDGVDMEIKVYCPTFAEWVESIGEERLASRFNQGLIAHDLAGKLKGAFKPAGKNPREGAEAAKALLRKQVQDPETVFDLREFIAAEKKAKEDKAAKAEAALEGAVEMLAETLGVSKDEAREMLKKRQAEKAKKEEDLEEEE